MTTQSTHLDPVTAAIQQAEAIAATTPNQVVTLNQPAAQNSLATLPAGVPISMESLMSGRMVVDGWIKVDKHGLIVKKELEESGLIETIKVKMNATPGIGFTAKQAIKFGGSAGTQASYHSTYDNATTPSGKSWAQACAEANQITPGAKPYPSADLVFEVLEAVPGKGGKIGAEVGMTLGHTLSTTNFSLWQKCYKQLVQENLIGEDVVLELGVMQRTNDKKQTWGILTFKVLGLADSE